MKSPFTGWRIKEAFAVGSNQVSLSEVWDLGAAATYWLYPRLKLLEKKDKPFIGTPGRLIKEFD